MLKTPRRKPDYPELPLIEGTKTIEHDPDQSKLTTLYTERAVKFIDAHKDRPFFLYVPHTMPHVPLYVSDKFKGKSPRGLYGDVIMEIDWSVGQILDALAKHKLDENTLVIFTSDNGPWLRYGDHGGSAGPLREGKGTAFEGGVRVPFIFRWPGRIPAGRECAEPAMTIDLLPTVAKLAGARCRATASSTARTSGRCSRARRGRSRRTRRSTSTGSTSCTPCGPASGSCTCRTRTAPRRRPAPAARSARRATRTIELSLFDLEADVGETKNVAAEHPDVVARLQARARSRETTPRGKTSASRPSRRESAPGKNVRGSGRDAEGRAC